MLRGDFLALASSQRTWLSYGGSVLVFGFLLYFIAHI
jgi:hypothetical protein